MPLWYVIFWRVFTYCAKFSGSSEVTLTADAPHALHYWCISTGTIGSILIQIWRLGTGKVFVRSPTKTYLRVYQTPNHFDGQEFWAQTFDFCAPYSEVTIGTSYDTDMNMLELLRARSFWQVCETVNPLPLTYIQDLVTWREYFEQFVVP